MNAAGLRARIPAINSWLLAVLFFLVPTQIAPIYLLSTLMLLLWLFEGRITDKLAQLRGEPLAWIFAAYYGVFFLSLLWTADTEWGWRMVGKQAFFLLFLLYFTVARREHFGRYLTAFLLGVTMCELFAYYNWVQLHLLPNLPDGVRVDKNEADTAPFVDWIMYAPILAWAGYLFGHQALFNQSRKLRWLSVLLFVTTAGNLLFSGGRAGMLGFLAMIALLVLQRFARRPVLAVLIALVVVGAATVGAYHANTSLRARADQAIDQVLNYENRPNTSVGLRITYTLNAWRIFMANPVLGVGAGDYPTEYKKMNALHTPQWEPAWNPHNQYMLALTSAGVLGGGILLLVLGWPLLRRVPPDGLGRMRIALPVLFIVICVFESYLMRSNISCMYVLFSAALWRGVREPQR